MNPKHIGGDFDSFLRDAGIFEEVETAATKAVIAFQVSREMGRRGLTKSEMAERMGTSRAALDRLLDPNNDSVTLLTLQRAARVLGKRLRLELTDCTLEDLLSMVNEENLHAEVDTGPEQGAEASP